MEHSTQPEQNTRLFRGHRAFSPLWAIKWHNQVGLILGMQTFFDFENQNNLVHQQTKEEKKSSQHTEFSFKNYSLQ